MFNMVNKMKIIDELIRFGLSRQEAEVYVALYKQGAKTPLTVAQDVGINRTTAYRVLEHLVAVGFVKKTLDYKSTSFEANSTESLKLFVAEKETEVQKLKQNIAPLDRLLNELPESSDSGPTKVYYFKGVSGLRQLLWNTLSAKDGVVGFGYEDWNSGIGRKFAEKIRAEYLDRHIDSKELLNEDQIDSTYSYTDVKRYPTIYEHRMIPKKYLLIRSDTYIYNDVVTYYHTYQGERFGIEIHNAEIAKTERQMFFILWNQAKKVK